MTYFEDVVAFHQAVEAPVGDKPVGQIREERFKLRLALMEEEWAELTEAMWDHDVVEIADACADLIVTVLGTAAEYGIPFDRVWAEVHASNMAKVGPDGVRFRADMKVLKPNGWRAPDIEKALGIGPDNE